jgi:hypothetical protein
MLGAIPSIPNTPSWRGVQLKEQGQLYLYLYLEPEPSEYKELSEIGRIA